MIESIRLSKIATYNSPVLISDLKEINFIYGANGAGKTSISRLISDPSISSVSQVVWRKGVPIETLVYNNDFVDSNFNSIADLKGVFTLGKAQQDQVDQIAAIKKDMVSLGGLRDRHQENLNGTEGQGGKVAELAIVEAAFKDKCWDQKRKFDDVFAGGFVGVRSSSDNFKAKVLSEKDVNTSELSDIELLKSKAKLLYSPAPALLTPIPVLVVGSMIALGGNPILRKRVLGKSDVDIAAMIAKLSNSDWVRQGLKYFEGNEGNCPFCQQMTNKDFEKSLNEYFDETFEADTTAIDALNVEYQEGASFVNAQIEGLMSLSSDFIEREAFGAQLQLLSSIISINVLRLESKRLEPSSEVELEPIDEVFTDITLVLDSANKKISQQNKLVTNFIVEQKRLTGQVWRYILDVELKEAIVEYEKKKESLTKAVTALSVQLVKVKNDILEKDVELRELEKTTTSIQPTVTAINHLLKSFGFKGFTLAVSPAGNSYKLLRADGSDAKTTLSEGEKTFVTFLYFYHLLKGSPTTSGMSADRVVVIDDPVSSLDSDILFIVASLIKKLFAEVREKKGYLKQVFILTHNVYFHKEITFNQKRKPKGDALSDESFWIVRKPTLHSVVDRYPTNPIKTSYELLWAELRRPDLQSLTIQNTLRRILENYFKILGGVDLNSLCENFEGEEAVHCKSLISWVNDGSHFAHDDLYVAVEETMVANYLKVFFKIFKKTKHMPHYEMMMSEHYIDLDPDIVDPLEKGKGDLDGMASSYPVEEHDKEVTVSVLDSEVTPVLQQGPLL